MENILYNLWSNLPLGNIHLTSSLRFIAFTDSFIHTHVDKCLNNERMLQIVPGFLSNMQNIYCPKRSVWLHIFLMITCLSIHLMMMFLCPLQSYSWINSKRWKRKLFLRTYTAFPIAFNNPKLSICCHNWIFGYAL